MISFLHQTPQVITRIPSAKPLSGMGVIPHGAGAAFRVWAPHAEFVSVSGTFNDWDCKAHPLMSEDAGYWYGNVPAASVGDEYRFYLRKGGNGVYRIDPYARQVTSPVGNAVIADPHFDWEDDTCCLPPHQELVLYELHIGTFGAGPGEPLPAGFAKAAAKLDYLAELGVNAVEVMPIAEFAGDFSWGYNPAHPFAVKGIYGGPKAFKEFVKAAHRKGIAVILDVVINHFGPGDLDLWRFDGWGDRGGIYFYNDWRARTPWGDTRPDFGRREVRQYLRDNILMWLEEFHVDGLRFDSTLYTRTVDGVRDLPDGWRLLQDINREIQQRFPDRLLIAEDLQNDDRLTRPLDQGGGGFHAQWDPRLLNLIRHEVTRLRDEDRRLDSIRQVLHTNYNGNPWQRVIYTESHDDVANGKMRLPSMIHCDQPCGWHSRKRSIVAATLALTAPGIPMLFQGQEFVQEGVFHDNVPLAWDRSEQFKGIVHLYRDLIHLRLNRDGKTRGLCGAGLNVFHANDGAKLLAFHRWDRGGPGDDVIVVVNFHHRAHSNYFIGLPRAGLWKLRLNSDWNGYSADFNNFSSHDVGAEARPWDQLPARGQIAIGPYSVLIFSQDAPH